MKQRVSENFNLKSNSFCRLFMHNFVICVDNTDYQASLEPRKIYEVLPDPEAESKEFLRVIDESGEDYLFPSSLFISLPLEDELAEQVAKIA